MAVDLDTLEQNYSLPSGLLSAVSHFESGDNPDAVNNDTATGQPSLGRFQFQPSIAKAYGIDPMNPDQAAVGAARMFADLSKQYHGDLDHMLGAYNWGSGNIARHGMENAPPETQKYIQNVKSMMQPEQQYPVSNQTPPSDNSGILDGIISPAYGADENQKQDNEPFGLNDPKVPDSEPFGLNDPKVQPSQFSLGAQQLLSSDTAPDLSNTNTQGLKEGLAKLPYKTDPIRSAYQSTMNTVAKPINSAINNVISPVMGAAASAEEKPAQSVANAVNSTDAGQWVGDKLLGAKDYVGDIGANIKDLESYNPDLQKDLDALNQNAELAGNMAGIKPLSKLTGNVVGKIGDVIGDSGQASADAKRAKDIFDVITPKLTPTVAKDLGTRSTSEGLNAVRTPQPTDFENKVIDTVSDLTDAKGNSLIKKSDPLHVTYNKLAAANEAEAEDLKSTLSIYDNADPAAAIIPKQEILDTVKKQLASLQDNAYIKDSPHLNTVLDDLSSQISKISDDGVTASQLLDIRKTLDKNITKYKGEGAFDPVKESAFTEAGKAVRQATNDIIANKYPDIGVRDSLDKQFHIYNAMDAVESKIPSQSAGAIGRAVDKVKPYMPKTIAGGLGEAALLTGAYVAPSVALPLAGVGLAGYGGYKALMSPMLRKGIGSTLSTVGDLLGREAPAVDMPWEIPPKPDLSVPTVPQQLALPAPQQTLALPAPTGGPDFIVGRQPYPEYPSQNKGAPRASTQAEREAAISGSQNTDTYAAGHEPAYTPPSSALSVPNPKKGEITTGQLIGQNPSIPSRGALAEYNPNELNASPSKVEAYNAENPNGDLFNKMRQDPVSTLAEFMQNPNPFIKEVDKTGGDAWNALSPQEKNHAIRIAIKNEISRQKIAPEKQTEMALKMKDANFKKGGLIKSAPKMTHKRAEAWRNLSRTD